MKKLLILIQIISISLSLAPAGVCAQIIELEGTAAIINEPSAKLIISEISFKNSTADFVKIYYQSPSNKPINLKGISFKDDSVFKTIDSDFTVNSGTYITLKFKSELPDSVPDLFTSHTGLTGTTEQFIILDRDKQITDALCWTSKTPTASEIDDQNKLFTAGGWNSADISTCFPSDAIKTNQSLTRAGLQDTNAKEDWQLPAEPAATGTGETTPESSPDSSTQTTAAQPGSAAAVSAAKISTTATTQKTAVTKTTAAKKSTSTVAPAKKTSTAKKTTTKKSAAKYKNGDLSDSIHISEFLPAPDKNKDQKNEWIEILNSGEADINLGNWQIDDKEGGSSPYTLPDSTVIPAGSVILIDSTQSKLSLSNTSDQVRLLNYKGEIIDDISYEDAPKGQSYSLIKTITATKNFSEFIWTKDPTPGVPNPEYYELTGKIITPAAFDAEYYFEIQDDKKSTTKIFFDEAVIAGPLAKITFTTDSTGKFLVDQNKKLIKFEIMESAPPKQNNDIVLPGIIASLAIFAAGAIYFTLKKSPPAVSIQK